MAYVRRTSIAQKFQDIGIVGKEALGNPSTASDQQQIYPSSRPTARPFAAAPPPNNMHETTTAGWIVIGIVLFFTFAGLIFHYFFIHLPTMQKEKEKRILAKQANQIKG